MGFVHAHFVAYATGLGASTIAAAGALASVGALSIVGALVFGFSADRLGHRPVLALAYVFRGAGYAILLLADSLPVATLGVMVSGLSWTSVISLTGAVSADQFGLRRLGTVYGAIFSVMPVGTSLGVWVAGQVFDSTGSYDAALWASMLLGLAAAAIVGLPRYRSLPPTGVPAPGVAG